MPSVNGLVAIAGQAAHRAIPGVDRAYWTLRQTRSTRAGVRALRAQISAIERASTRDRPVHLVVVPDIGALQDSWHVAGGNITFELWQSAVELLGADRVTLMTVAADEPPPSWHRRLLDTVAHTGATHVIAQTESDPNDLESWTWDIVGAALAASWDGTFIAFMYDSAYEWLRVRARRLGGLVPHLLIADLCVPMTGFIRPGRYEVGPVTMPISQASVTAIDSHVSGMEKAHDVTFIGTLYEYRVDLLEPIKALGFDAVINPHRPEAPQDREAQTPRSSYLDYMAALARSELTINFSLARGGPHEQFKTRMLEAPLVGCLALTDDRDRTRGFFAADEFAEFSSPDHLDEAVARLLADRDALHLRQQRARARAHELTRTDFWGRIEDGLRRRGRRGLTGVRPPTPSREAR
jgi:hypothetical protein